MYAVTKTYKDFNGVERTETKALQPYRNRGYGDGTGHSWWSC